MLLRRLPEGGRNHSTDGHGLHYSPTACAQPAGRQAIGIESPALICSPNRFAILMAQVASELSVSSASDVGLDVGRGARQIVQRLEQLIRMWVERSRFRCWWPSSALKSKCDESHPGLSQGRSIT